MRELIQAEQALGDYTRKHARHIIAGELGNNAGTVDHPTRTNFVYVKLHGDDNQVVEAEAVASFPHQAGIIVAVELVKRNAASRYQVLGIASNILFVNSTWAGTVGEHADQHQRRDLGQGGFDPLDIYNRALVNLRGRAQATPDLTVYVERGFYFIGGALYEWTGGNSAAFTVPAGSFGVTVRRCDLLYIGSDQALHIVQGATTSDGSVPAYPTTPYPCIPIAYVYLASSTTSIQESNIKDARVILTASDGTPVAHNLLSTTHGDTLAASVAAGDIIIGNDTPKWSRLAITVPAANVRNVVGVDNGETKPSWKTALDATTPADIAGTAAAGTSLVFAHRDHVHRGVLSINKAADTTLYGAVTLSEGANITLTQVGQDIAIAAAAGGGAHTILSATHTDTLADTVVDGDVLIGNATPKWSRLAISIPAANVRNVLGIDNAELRPSWKTALDGTAPTTIGVSDVAAAGTSLIFSHRDHQHGSPATFPATAHNLFSTTHGDTTGAASPVDGDIIIGNVTPKWSKLAISIPAAGVLNYLGVNNGELRPSWKSASSNPGTAAAILATDSSGILKLFELQVTGTADPVIILDGTSGAQIEYSKSSTIKWIEGTDNGGSGDNFALFNNSTGFSVLTANITTNNVDISQSLSIGAGTAYTAISSNPGAAAAILATNASGYLQLVRVGIGAAPSVRLDVNGVDGTTSYIVGRISGASSGYGSYLQFTDGVTYNYAFGTNTSGSFEWVSGRYPGAAGTVRMTLFSTGGLNVGAPTGGDKGVGTANFAGDIYKNNTAYANPAYALEHWAEGSIITHADKPGAQDYRRLTLGEVEDYVRRHYELPGHRDSFGLFDGGDWMLEKVEELATYVIELHHRVEKLERGN